MKIHLMFVVYIHYLKKKVIKLAYLTAEVIKTLDELKPYSNDNGLDLIYVEIDNNLYPIEEIILNEDKQIVFKL